MALDTATGYILKISLVIQTLSFVLAKSYIHSRMLLAQTP